MVNSATIGAVARQQEQKVEVLATLEHQVKVLNWQQKMLGQQIARIRANWPAGQSLAQ